MTEDANSPVVKEGWLQKRGEYIQNWRRRYFVLKEDGRFLGYKCKPGTPQDFNNVLNKFTVKDCQILTSDTPKPFTFFIRGLQMTVEVQRTFHVETEQERKDWLDAIKQVKRCLEGTKDGVDPMLDPILNLQCSDDRKVANDPCEALESLFANTGEKLHKSGMKKVTFENFEFIKVLGKGSFGKVILCREKETSQLYAIKILKKEVIRSKGTTEMEHIMTENRVLQSTRHPFIIGLQYSFKTEDRLCFVMEYVNGGELYFHLRKEFHFTQDRTRFYAAEIISAISYLHKRGIIYRDLKPENLLLDKDGHIKVADFGLCKEHILFGKTTNTICGTPEYLAPEIAEMRTEDSSGKSPYGRAVDWWGVGVVIFEMLLGRLPFQQTDPENPESIYNQILRLEVKYPRSMSWEAKDLLEGLLKKDPLERLGGGREDAEEIMKHPFFGPINWADLNKKKLKPPFKPQVKSEVDTQYFGTEFTGESVELTPPETERILRMNTIKEDKEDGFDDFSFQNPNSLLGAQSLHSTYSLRYQI